VLWEKIKRITRVEILTIRPNSRHKDALKYYKAGHNNSKEPSFIIILVVYIIDVEEGRRFDWWIETHLENRK
jgi:hypothetical protein